MNAFKAGIFGIAVVAALWSLVPSKTEDRWDRPYASMMLAFISGLSVAVGLAL